MAEGSLDVAFLTRWFGFFFTCYCLCSFLERKGAQQKKEKKKSRPQRSTTTAVCVIIVSLRRNQIGERSPKMKKSLSLTTNLICVFKGFLLHALLTLLNQRSRAKRSLVSPPKKQSSSIGEMQTCRDSTNSTKKGRHHKEVQTRRREDLTQAQPNTRN